MRNKNVESENRHLFDTFSVQNCLIGRSTSGEPYQDIAIVDGQHRVYVDTDVNADVTYCYTVVAQVLDPITYEACDLPSNEECLSTCSLPSLDPMDVVFIIDNTGSQTQDWTLDTVKTAVIQSLEDIAAAGVPYRLALLTPDNDQVNVRTNFSTNNRTAFQDAVELLPDLGGLVGNKIPESTDECVYTAVHARAAIDAVSNPTDCTRNNPATPLQIGDFSPAFSSTRKFIVLITDAPPGGFCDPFDFDASVDGARAHTYAQDARTNCIKINAIQVPGRGSSTDIEAMLDYRDATCGWYSHPGVDVDEIREAIATMLYTPGVCSCP